MVQRKPLLPPSRAVIVSLPLTLIEQLDFEASKLGVARSTIIRRALTRNVSELKDQQQASPKKWWQGKK